MAPSPAEAQGPGASQPGGSPKRSALGARVASALVLAPVALGLVWLGGLPFEAAIMAAAVLMAGEWARMTGGGRLGPAGLLLGATAALAVVSVPLGAGGGAVAIGLVVAGLLVYGLARGQGVEAPAWLAAGVVAIGLPCLAFVWLRQAPAGGSGAVIWLLAVVWATDIGAYAAGRSIGGPRLAPRISPNKTWAGLLGGMVAAGLVSAGLGSRMTGDVGGLVWIAAGLGMAVVAQIGDLAESLAKRRFGVKDSGGLIPGHGGILDRVDGLMTTAPLLALVLGFRGVGVFGWG